MEDYKETLSSEHSGVAAQIDLIAVRTACIKHVQAQDRPSSIMENRVGHSTLFENGSGTEFYPKV